MVDGYFEREVTKCGVKKGAGWPLTYSMEINEQLLVWVLENCDLYLLITIPLLQAKAMELIGTECPDFKASSGWVYKIHASTISCTHIHGPRIACYPKGIDSSILSPDKESG